MKKLKILIIPFILAGMIGCVPQAEKCPEVDFDKELSEIRSVLEQYELARESEDFSTVEQIWASDSTIILFGTEGDEQMVGFTAINKAMSRQFNEVENTLINISEQKIKISKDGNVAWFSQVLDYNFNYQGEYMTFEGIRSTGVMEKRDGIWKLVQGHLSVPYEADLEEEPR
ncbi:MAG: nuclear transport factor 2 family protein [Bacteroidales bacterium]|nr:nuclear transport factor 2 family protein [Bacteroidales bacterium]